ncbi:MAG: hypothetical protein KKC11_02915 [Candidatus Omnitrophica bacterium]|nr:hypothetical protein [Candidatus Omnitrophota bacterium]MBU0897393.1 hypothetical protein [Candidatus Omnitrophota bacterium]MBU1133701.1 hypothetical protein [Candidatus Omnitrophota bacterium]MBU1366923.1 hypothetical protein [Candidatus Omnitrophota bacterium]MBU1523760.1 hypothetical protein [Candidatus Omnitrophota bacterium]
MAIAKSSNHTKEETITARCDIHIKETLDILSQSEHLSKSEIMAKSILEYYQRHFPSKAFLKTERELFGRYGSDKGDLSIKRKKYIGEVLDRKHSHN